MPAQLTFTNRFLRARPSFLRALMTSPDYRLLFSLEFPRLNFNGTTKQERQQIKALLEECGDMRADGSIERWEEFLCIQLKQVFIGDPTINEIIREAITRAIGDCDLIFWLRKNAMDAGRQNHVDAIIHARSVVMHPLCEDGQDYYMNLQSFLRVIWIDIILKNL